MLSLNKKTFILFVILSLAAGFTGGFLINNEKTDSPVIAKEFINKDGDKKVDIDFSLFWNVYNDLNAKYVDSGKLDANKVLYGAISGMVNSVGDPYTVFFEPVTSRKFQEEISGSFGGIGIEIGKRNGVLTVIAPIKDTPAFKANIKAGDKILKIDSKSTANFSIEEAVNLIRGKKGTKIILTTQNSTTRDVELIRDTIKIPTISWELIENDKKRAAYMQIFPSIRPSIRNLKNQPRKY